MTVMPIDDQAPEQSLEEQIEAKVAARFGGTPEEQPAEEAAPEDIFELDWEGEKYNLPAKLKSAFMMQKDYTQKTQETAELARPTNTPWNLLSQPSWNALSTKA